jgi:hypothetical protein
VWESKVAPLTGVAFAVLLVLGSVIVGNYDFMPPAAEVAAFYAGAPLRIMAGSYIGILSAVALLWFSGSLYAFIRGIGEDRRRLALIAFGGGGFASAMLALGYLSTTAGAERAQYTGIDPVGAATLFDISSVAVSTAGMGLAVMIGAWTVATLRSPGQPRWVAWVSGLIALGLISPLGWALLVAGLVWVPLVGVSIYRNMRRRVGAEAASR